MLGSNPNRPWPPGAGNEMKVISCVFVLYSLLGCSVYSAKTSDPTERGLAYVASAIIVAAIIRALFND